MSAGKNKPFVVTTIGALLAITLFTCNPEQYGASLHSPWINKLVCHFHHANLFHWGCNALAMALMRPSPREWFCAYPLAVASMFFTTTPTIGASALIYAYIGMNIIRWNISLIDWAFFIVGNIMSAFLPGIAFGVHFAAFILGIITYKLIGIKRTDRRKHP